MTIQELGSVGELVAAVATVATLLYLELQIRQNARETRAASFHAITDSMNSVNVAVVQSAELSRIWVVGRKARGSLSEEERHWFYITLLSYFHVFETMHYQARVGAGEGHLVVAEERSLVSILSTPGAREWWAENPYAFGPEFREYIDRFVAETPVDQG